jgi:hypothetical protein
MTLALGVMDCRPQRSVVMSTGSMQEEAARDRARAIVSPPSEEIEVTAPGKGPAGAPAFAALNRPLRPCTSGDDPAGAPAGSARVWQPLHSRTSPGRTDSHERWVFAVLFTLFMRRPFASSRLN